MGLMNLGLLLFISLIIQTRAKATIYYSTNFDSNTCNSPIQDASYIQGKMWDLWTGDAAYPLPSIKCDANIAKSNYVRWTTICPGYDANDRCTPANNSNVTTNAAGIEVALGNSGFTPAEGVTYFLGGHFRFDRINNRDVWLDSGRADSFDKLIEMGCAGCNFRWGIGAGWPSGNHVSTDHKFTFDAWCASTSFAGCQTTNNADHKVQNASGYNSSTPFLAEYERWYSVVLAVTASTSANSGRVRLYINGTMVIDKTNVTMGSNSALSDRIVMNGTIAQPQYDVPSHNRSFDNIVFTNSLVDIQTAGLMQDPQSSMPSPILPKAPDNLRIGR